VASASGRYDAAMKVHTIFDGQAAFSGAARRSLYALA